MTRPNIAYATQHLSQFVHQPKHSHYEAAIRVIIYIKVNLGHGLLIYCTNRMDLTISCDSELASCVFSRRSISAYCVKLGGDAIAWKVKKASHTIKIKYRNLISKFMHDYL